MIFTPITNINEKKDKQFFKELINIYIDFVNKYRKKYNLNDSIKIFDCTDELINIGVIEQKKDITDLKDFLGNKTFQEFIESVCFYKENKNDLEKNIRGFYILRKESYFFPAKINLSHSFIIKDINSYVGEDNLEEKDKKIIKNFLLSYIYTDYDKLIQVLDNSIKDDYIGIEKYQKYLKEKYKKIPYEKERIKILESYQKYFENKLKNPIEYYVNKNIKK